MSLAILTFMSHERWDILGDIVGFLFRHHLVPTDWELNFLDLIIISTIPLWTMISYRKTKQVTLTRIVFTDIIAVLTLFLTVIIAYSTSAFVFRHRPLREDFDIHSGFEHYQTFALLLGVAITLTIFNVHNRRTKTR